MNEDEYVAVEMSLNRQASELQLSVRAKKAVTLTELQGSRTVVDAFGAGMPSGFSARQYGEGVDIPEEMKAEMEHMNRLNFRWACSVPVGAGSAYTVRIPASGGPGADSGVLTLAYEYPKLFGLLKGKGAIYVSLSPAS